jgi:copper resistance protein B
MTRRVFASLVAAAGLLASPALAQDHSGHGAVRLHDPPTWWFAGGEIEAWETDGDDHLAWEFGGWRGGDVNRVAFRAEGEADGGDVESSEVWLLYSRNVAPFWDLQAGVREDVEPDGRTHAVIGLQGLAPYWFETRAFAFVDEEGVASARFEQALDIYLTQRLAAEPFAEVEAFAEDVPERGVGAGFSSLEAGLQLRYEVTRKFAPYLSFTHERLLGETAELARDAGASTSDTSLRAGLRVWF